MKRVKALVMACVLAMGTPPAQSVTYTAFHRPKSISQSGKTVTFTYDGNDRLVKSAYNDGSVKYYLGGYVEYSPASGSSAESIVVYMGGDFHSASCVYEHKGGTTVKYSVFRDYLGNVLGMSSADGSYIAEYSYDPWGRMRDPATHAVYASGDEPTIKFGRGFGSHLWLPDFGLVHMNARLYDPVLGRFLSPDPYVQAPDSPQNFNRYSYCLNNPLIYSDPTGEWFGIDDLIIGAVGFVAGYLANGISTGNWGWSSVKAGLMSTVTSVVGYNTMGLATGAISAAMWNQAGNIAMSAMSSTLGLDFSIGPNFSIGLSPLLGFGTGGFSYGLGISASYSHGKWGIGGGVGLGNFYTGCSARTTYDGYGLGFSQTHFSPSSSFHGTSIGPQSTGTISLLLDESTFSFTNDILGDKQDRWRTTSAELSKGKYSIGTYVNTNYGKEAGGGTEIRSTPYWVLDKSHESFKNGEVYYSPLWLGVASKDLIYRVGFSHPRVQNYTQNLVHSKMSTPYYIDYKNNKLTPYGQFGTKNPYTLWNR